MNLGQIYNVCLLCENMSKYEITAHLHNGYRGNRQFLTNLTYVYQKHVGERQVDISTA